MKTLRLILLTLLFAAHANAQPIPEVTAGGSGGEITLHAVIPGDREKAPAFAKISVEQKVEADAENVRTTADVSVEVQRGELETISLEIAGNAAVEKIDAPVQMRDWSVRSTASRQRFLDVRLKEPLPKGENPFKFKVVFAAHNFKTQGTVAGVPALVNSDLGVFSGRLILSVPQSANMKITESEGLSQIREESAGSAGISATRRLNFIYDSLPTLTLSFEAEAAPATLEKFSLRGDFTGGRFGFVLAATAKVRVAGAELPILGGVAALREFPKTNDFSVRLDNTTGVATYVLVFEKAGEFSVHLEFDARVNRKNDWQGVSFSIPCVQLAPISVGGFSKDTQFDVTGMPAFVSAEDRFTNFLPLNGAVSFAWLTAKADSDARLFFSTEEVSEISIRPGLLSQTGRFAYKILQGKIETLRFELQGAGEILRVTGNDILSWNVADDDSKDFEAKLGVKPRILTVRLAQPKTGEYTVGIETQSPVGNFPATIAPLQISPSGGVRHSGFAAVTNEGAVRIEATPKQALTQVAPALFPAKTTRGTGGQIFVFRVANAEYAMEIHADNILPEVGVSSVAIYGVGESDLYIDAEIELDVREAPLREFAMSIPGGYSVSAAKLGTSEYVLGEEKNGVRELKIVPARPILGRQLAQVRLEKNRPANFAGTEWKLEQLAFPGAKSVRGYVGIVAIAGLRVTPAKFDGAVEVATAFFPKKIAGLQQAFRLRDTTWNAAMKVEKLDMSVQSDGLHLFVVREGTVSASTTMNYIIVGAPLGTFRFEVPDELRNLEFSGRDIRSWKRSGNVVEVVLHKPVSGAITLLGTYDMPLSSRGGVVSFVGLRPLDVQSEQGFAIVVSELQFNVSNGTIKNLIAVEPTEIPAEYRMMFDAPLLAAFQYSERPFELKLGLTPRQLGATMNQVVDFAELKTRVARDGQIVTEARYVVKSYGFPNLRVSVPAGLKLWTARVDNAEVLPVVDGADTLIPLPAHADANTASTVDLRFAGAAANAGKVRLDAPKIQAPVISTRWSLTPDEGLALRFVAGNLALERAQEKERDLAILDYLANLRSKLQSAIFWSLVLAGFGAAAFVLAQRLRAAGKTFAARITGGIAGVSTFGAIVGALAIFVKAPAFIRAVTGGELNFTAPINLAGETLWLSLDNGARAGGFSWGLALPVIAGILCMCFSITKFKLLRALGWTFFGCAALLASRGLAWFALVCALFLIIEIVIPGMKCFTSLKKAAPVLALFLALGIAGDGMFAKEAPAIDAYLNSNVDISRAVNTNVDFTRVAKRMPQAIIPAGNVADAITQKIVVEEKRTVVTGTMNVTGKAGDCFDFLSSPAVLTKCEVPAGAHLLRKEGATGVITIQLVLDKAGSVSLTFEYNLPQGNDAARLILPTGCAAADTAFIVLSGSREIEFVSDSAVSVVNSPVAPAAGSNAYILFLPQNEREIRWLPKARDRRNETLQFYAEVADLFVPAPGVIDGRHRVKIRPAQGLVNELNFSVPAGLTVSNVQGLVVGRWRFDPEKRNLNVRIEPAQSSEFDMVVETQVAAGALPQTTTLEPLAVGGATGQIGLVGVAAGDEVQVLDAATTKLLPVDQNDFPGDLIRGTGAVLRRSYRYGAVSGASLVLKTIAVEPDVRIASTQTVSIGEDRVVLNATFAADITRAGVFRLSFDLPEGFEIESLTGPALSHWTEVQEGKKRVIVLHLLGRTLGKQNFSLALAGAGVGKQSNWNAPRVSIREASRHSGEMTIVPEEGLRLHVAKRDNATQFDPGREARLPKGALAFRLLQQDWRLAFDAESLTPWIQCEYLQDMTVRDGQVRGLVNFQYTIENAATKTLRVQLPADAGSVRFSGTQVADAVAVAGTPGLWEVKLQRRVLGKTTIQAVFQRPANGAGENVGTVSTVDVGLQHGWLALRTAGRLELKLGALPATLQATDWQSVPAALRAGVAEPAAVLRMIENNTVLPVSVVTHDPAKLLALRINNANLQTMLSDEGVVLTRVFLNVYLTEKGFLKITLPEDAAYWHGFVNNEAVRVAQDGRALLLPVIPNPVAGQPSEVEFYYSATTKGGSLEHKIVGPRFDVPLEDITWNVQLPDGRVLAKQKSDMQFVEKRSALETLAESGGSSLLSIADYQMYNKNISKSKEAKADQLIQLSNKLRSAGNQEKARQALALAGNLSKGNDALNEDARVQLNALRAEQIEVGMNRWMSNVAANTAGNLAINGDRINAPQQTSTNYAADEVAQQRLQNSAEDNAAIRKVAERILTQQQSTTAALDSIRTTIPVRGETLTFKRSLQVGADSDLSVQLTLEKPARAGVPGWVMAAVGLLLFAIAAILSRLVRAKA